MGHGTNDKLFITPSEYSGVHGEHGASTGAKKQQSVIVPFHMCAITHQPWTTPVCIAHEGLVYDRVPLEAFLATYHVSPATGEKVAQEDIVPLHFSKNERGHWQDPVSFRELTDFSHIVAIQPTGHVYLYDTVQQLNLKTKMMQDLLTDTPFTKKHIITLQDPHDPTRRKMQDMYHVQHQLTLKQESHEDDVNAAATGSTKTLLAQLRQSKKTESAAPDSTASAPADAVSTAPVRYSNRSTGMTAASFTSTSLTPRTKTEQIAIDEEEHMLETVAQHAGTKKKKGLVRLQTNFGALNLELYVDKAPRTCYNFLMLCRQGKYNNTIFHRNIPGFMIQGGDPTGTGRGGESIWGKPFADELCNAGAYRHESRGTLSMANKGYNTNGSQFFITYRATPHLDSKHTVFGHLISDTDQGENYRVLDALERVPNEPDTTTPMRPIKLLEAQVFEDPFEEYIQRRDAKVRRDNPDEEERAKREAKRRRREEDRTTWLGTRLGAKDGSTEPASTPATQRFAPTDEHGLAGLRAAQAAAAPPPRRRPGSQSRGKGFGDFSQW